MFVMAKQLLVITSYITVLGSLFVVYQLHKFLL